MGMFGAIGSVVGTAFCPVLGTAVGGAVGGLLDGATDKSDSKSCGSADGGLSDALAGKSKNSDGSVTFTAKEVKEMEAKIKAEKEGKDKKEGGGGILSSIMGMFSGGGDDGKSGGGGGILSSIMGMFK